MMTVKEVAERLNLSHGAVYKAIHDGELEHHRFGAAIRITEAQLTAFLEETRVRGEAAPIYAPRFKHL